MYFHFDKKKHFVIKAQSDHNINIKCNEVK